MFESVTTFIDNLIAGDDKVVWFTWLFYIAVVLGAWKIFCWILTPLLTCLKHCCRCRQNLIGKYGREGAYAVVTGGSDGIGLELCH